jgi:hypothetical protein
VKNRPVISSQSGGAGCWLPAWLWGGAVDPAQEFMRRFVIF